MEFDEFGNPLGSPADSTSDSDGSVNSAHLAVDVVPESSNGSHHQVTLHENKVYYPRPDQVYSPSVEVLHYEADTETINEPLVKPQRDQRHTKEVDQLPKLRYDWRFHRELQKIGGHTRNVVVAGSLGHGKTTILDALVRKTHEIPEFKGKLENKPLRYTDTHNYEADRGISIFSSPVSLLLQNSQGKSFVFNMLDSPGHTDFVDELAYGLQLAEGIVLVIDVVEGFLPMAKVALTRAGALKMSVILVLNKIDRLILDLRLPPSETYHRLDYLLDEINEFATRAGVPEFEPRKENVVFASGEHRWSFTLLSFARKYSEQYNLDEAALSEALWGDVFYENGGFTAKGEQLTFSALVLDPLYKLYSSVVTENADELTETLASLNLNMMLDSSLNYKSRLTSVFSHFLGSWSCLTDVILNNIPGPERAIVATESEFCAAVIKNVMETTGDFLPLVKILKGSISVGQSVNCYFPDGQVVSASISALFTPQSQYKISESQVHAGQWALVDGLRGAPLGSYISTLPLHEPPRFEKLSHASVQLGVEALQSSQTPRLLESIKFAMRLFPGLEASFDDAGYTLYGTGELYFDTVMYYIRHVFDEVEVKVTDPGARFAESCAESSFASCPTAAPNGNERVTIVASALQQEVLDLVKDMEFSSKEFRTALKSFGWDNMAVSSVMDGAPIAAFDNILMNDALGDSRKLVDDQQQYFVEAFRACCRAGPLCDQPIKNVLFKVIDFQVSSPENPSTTGQLIATIRKACYAAFLVATPRLMEPYFEVVVIGPIRSGRAVYENLRRRRGVVLDDRPVFGTNLFRIEGQLPITDSFGFEVDVRVATAGQTQVIMTFAGWELVPGNPLDTTVKVKPLESARGHDLARDFVVRTRRRKGLAFEPSLVKYLDEDVADLLGVEN